MAEGCAVMFRILYSWLSIMLIIVVFIHLILHNFTEFRKRKEKKRKRKRETYYFLPCHGSLSQFTEAGFWSDQHHGQKQNHLALSCPLRNLHRHVGNPPQGLITETNRSLQHHWDHIPASVIHIYIYLCYKNRLRKSNCCNSHIVVLFYNAPGEILCDNLYV